jgi:hypothetical protein
MIVQTAHRNAPTGRVLATEDFCRPKCPADAAGPMVTAAGTGNNRRQRGVCKVIAELSKEEIHASNL